MNPLIMEIDDHLKHNVVSVDNRILFQRCRKEIARLESLAHSRDVLLRNRTITEYRECYNCGAEVEFKP